MKFSEAKTGRTFILRLEDGDVLHSAVEKFARCRSIRRASVIAVGGADKGSRLVAGPEDGRASIIRPMERPLDDVHEIAGVGTIFPDVEIRPMLHMHAACGRGDATTTGCVRKGVKTWHVMEVIIQELINESARRIKDKVTGFELLEP